MIKVEMTDVTIEGKGHTVLPELSIAIQGVYKAVAKETDERFAKEMVEKALRLAFYTEDELEDELIKTLKELKSTLEEGAE